MQYHSARSFPFPFLGLIYDECLPECSLILFACAFANIIESNIDKRKNNPFLISALPVSAISNGCNRARQTGRAVAIGIRGLGGAVVIRVDGVSVGREFNSLARMDCKVQQPTQAFIRMSQ
jgi:hypothetical protein